MPSIETLTGTTGRVATSQGEATTGQVQTEIITAPKDEILTALGSTGIGLSVANALQRAEANGGTGFNSAP